MRRLLLLGLFILLASCKSATPVVKEKPVADPLYTSKLISSGGLRASNPITGIPLPPPPPTWTTPGQDGPTQLASEP
ncbi:MAG: hypothetical protein SNJ82_02510 [Gemmataceae bacterium]